DADSNHLFVKNLTDRSISVYDLTEALEEGNFPSRPDALVSSVASEILPSNVLRGKQVFYNAADPRMGMGYISCAVCHQDGDHDGRIWDFTARGEGLRNTTNLRGRAGMGHGNVHWSANFDEIQDFDIDMSGPFGGSGFLNGTVRGSLGAPNAGRDSDLDALAAYVTSLGLDTVEKSPHRNPDGSLTADAMAGKQLFDGTVLPANSGVALDCASCHIPATEFTDSTLGDNSMVTLHDVGTIKAPTSGERLGGGPGSLTGIDTPTLLGVHASAPYLHDGSAETLSDVFTQFVGGASLGQPGSAHNLSASGYDLTAAEEAALIAFLRQIDGSPDVTAPETPTGVVATPGDGSVSLAWEQNTEIDFAGYSVYRSVTPSSYGAALATGLANSSFTDTTAQNGVTYFYTVTASDSIGNESSGSVEIWAQPTPPSPDMRVTEYYLTTGDFSGTTTTLTLDQSLATDYFILVRGSRTGDGSSFPDNDYVRIVSVPGGRGHLADSGAGNLVGFQRGTADFDWEGVVTVVECQNPASPAGFQLLDAVVTPMTSTSGISMSSVPWNDLHQVVLFGGYRGGGVEMLGSPSNRKEGTGCYTRLFPSGSQTLNWSRQSGGEILFDATMTTFVTEWGSEWTVQHVNVAGNHGGNGANATGEYTTAAIAPVQRNNTWVWASGHRVDSGVGDCAEACLVTLGDGVTQNALESTVAVGSEYTDFYDFDVYTLTHPLLHVDHRFKVDGDPNALDLPITVDKAAPGTRFGWAYNGLNGAGAAFPRPRLWSRYTDDGTASDSTITISRGHDGQAFPAWIQGIDFSSLNP
ncbi:MAG: hypothetical protein AAGJ31_02745, partial [Verrucomicrobiota bacterium]